MIIKSLEIQNFRSYYKTNVFNFCDGLNLIIGSNGDGKTTLFEALEWVFRTDDVVKTDVKFISKKRAEELFSGDSDNVSVSVTYEHNGSQKNTWMKNLDMHGSAQARHLDSTMRLHYCTHPCFHWIHISSRRRLDPARQPGA